MAEVFVVAKRLGGSGASVLSRPKIFVAQDEKIRDVYPVTGAGAVIKFDSGDLKQIEVYETPRQVSVARNPASTSGYAGDKKLDYAGNASTQSTTTELTTYLSGIATATAGSADACKLDAATVGKVRVVVNLTAVAIKVFPASSGYIDAKAQNVHVTLAARGMAAFVCKETGKWVSATGSEVS